jgi:4-diphosphocytidyl-2-C-methyl-D-erythritol kinase
MPEVTTWPAPAKLNLFLHVTGRRANGYHELQTVFQLLDWGDTVSIQVLPQGGVQRSRPLDGVHEDEDLASRAARLLRLECGVGQGALIAVEKHIPMGSGLGGGSSDAATVLCALNRLWGCGLAVDQLAELGLRLGADVPLFVLGRSAFAEGVGEELVALELGQRYYLLVWPELYVSTATVFADPRLQRDLKKISLAQVRDNADFSGMENVCQPVVEDLLPPVRELVQVLGEFGPVRMSGTGSALFVRMPDHDSAQRAALEMKSRYNARAVAGLDRSPLLERLGEGSPGG